VKPGVGRPSTELSDADVIALAIASCQSLLDDQTFGPLARMIDVRRDVPPEVRDGQDADYKSAVFTITSCLIHSVGDRALPRDIEVLLQQGMDEYSGHRPSPELLANEMRRTAMRLSIALPESARPARPTAPRPPKRTSTAPPPPPPVDKPAPVSEAAPVTEPATADEPATVDEPAADAAPAAEPATRRAASSVPVETDRPAAPKTPRGPRRILLVTLGVVVVAAVLGVAIDHLVNSSSTKAHPITAKAATGAALRVRKIAIAPGPNGQTQLKISPAIESKLKSPMTLPGGPGGQLMLLTDPLPGEWKPSVTPRNDLVQLPLDASTFGSTRSGAVLAVPANPVSPSSTFTDSNGDKHQTLVSTMKDQQFAAGSTLPNSKDKDVVVYDVPDGTSVLAFAIVSDDGFVIASTLRSSMPAPSDPSSF
jgi:hypothetical protein